MMASNADSLPDRILSHDFQDPSTGMLDTSPDEASSYDRMNTPSRGEHAGHAIFGILLGVNLIEKYEIWKRRGAEQDNVVLSFVSFGNSLNGHSGVVHGGILSLIFDDVCGFAYDALGVTHAVTANLNVDYRAPVLQNTEVRIAVQLSGRDGRKLYWKAQMTSMDQQTLYAEATSLYIVPNQSRES